MKDEEKVKGVLAKYLEAEELSYYRYLTLPTSFSKWKRMIGVLQFRERVCQTLLRRKFQNDTVYMDVLITAKRPMILMFMRMYVLAEYHGLSFAKDTKSSGTPFGFGGKKTTNEIKYMKPYIKALTLYKDYDKPDFPYRDLCEARRICKFKYMVEKN